MFYFVKIPWWLKKIYGTCTWQINTAEKIIYLSFDDGPHPIATPFVLAVLKKYNAKATFFCIGKNVAAWPAIYQQIIDDGHTVGNHTYDHLNGWKTDKEAYLQNIQKAQILIGSSLYRPPYGKITFRQIRDLLNQPKPLKIIMWSVLSADFDKRISNDKCVENVIKNTGKGSIVVFHDSEKAFEKLQFTLPKILTHFEKSGFKYQKIDV